jgi:Flp pilus assembly protein TadG
MTIARACPRRLIADCTGAIAIEVALVIPLLALISLGAFQVSGIVARQSEIQTAVGEAAAIALATDPDTQEERATIKAIMMTSTGLPGEKISVTESFRCGAEPAYVQSFGECSQGDKVSSFVTVSIRDTYVPIWTQFGVGSPMEFNVSRRVMYKQATKP